MEMQLTYAARGPKVVEALTALVTAEAPDPGLTRALTGGGVTYVRQGAHPVTPTHRTPSNRITMARLEQGERRYQIY